MNVWDILVMDSDDILLGTSGGIFKSSDNGNQWALFGTGLPADEVERIAGAENGDLYAGMFQSGIYKSTDNGATWTSSNNGLPANAQVTAMCGIINGEVYAGIFPEGMFRTQDNGNSWQPFNNGLPFLSKEQLERGYSITAISVMHVFLLCLVYIIGVFVLHPDYDFEDAWTPWTSGLPDDPTLSKLATGPVEKIFVGTYEQGLYRNNWAVGIPESSGNPRNYSIINYPNPFSDRTTLSFRITEPEHIQMVISSSTGQVVDVISNRIYKEGKHTINWETDGLSPGIYYLRMQADSHSFSRKLIVTH